MCEAGDIGCDPIESSGSIALEPDAWCAILSNTVELEGLFPDGRVTVVAFSESMLVDRKGMCGFDCGHEAGIP
jgi:hypothetical protein